MHPVTTVALYKCIPEELLRPCKPGSEVPGPVRVVLTGKTSDSVVRRYCYALVIFVLCPVCKFTIFVPTRKVAP